MIALVPSPGRLPLILFAALFVGYACSYFHRADVAALGPIWAAADPQPELFAALPDIASLGMLVYALGKFAGGALAERFGGERLFVIALGVGAIAELLAASCQQPLPFALCRVVGMAALALAWPSLGHIVAAHTSRRRLATVMAVMSQSYLLGDAAVRSTYAVVARGGSGQAVLHTGAAGLAFGAVVVVAGVFAHRGWRRPVVERTTVVRTGETERSRAVVVAAAIDTGRAGGASCAVGPAEIASLTPGGDMKWLATISSCLAFVREALAFWSPLLLIELGGHDVASAVAASALLPIASGLGALAAGPLADRSPRVLAWVMTLPAAVGAAGLAWLAMPWHHGALALPVLALVSAALAMPTSLASGVLPLRAARGGARRLGIVDGAGTLGAVFAGGGLARLRSAFDSTTAFSALAIAAMVAGVAALGFVRAERRGRSASMRSLDVSDTAAAPRDR